MSDMRARKTIGSLTVALCCAALSAGGAHAAPATGFIEAGAGHHGLSQGYGDWSIYYLRAVAHASTDTVWNADMTRQREFGDEGTYFSLGATHTINPDWHTFLSAGGSSGGSFLPRFRADAFLSRKWLSTRRLVTTLGAGYYKAKDAHRDQSVFLGATYYFPTPWIVEGGVRWNESNPNSVVSRSQFFAVTQGREKDHYLTLRVGGGNEAYQPIGSSAALVDFPSDSVSLGWRQWLRDDWGLNVLAERYTNPSYRRTGITLGTFKHF